MVVNRFALSPSAERLSTEHDAIPLAGEVAAGHGPGSAGLYVSWIHAAPILPFERDRARREARSYGSDHLLRR